MKEGLQFLNTFKCTTATTTEKFCPTQFRPWLHRGGELLFRKLPIYLNLWNVFSCSWLGRQGKTGREYVKIKVKCTLVQALRLCTGRTAH